MANVLVGNPWRVDTAGVLTLVRMRLFGLRWVGATTAGHQAIIQDGLGREIWASVAAGANYVESDTVHATRLYRGLTVVTLDSGVLYLEIG